MSGSSSPELLTIILNECNGKKRFIHGLDRLVCISGPTLEKKKRRVKQARRESYDNIRRKLHRYGQDPGRV